MCPYGETYSYHICVEEKRTSYEIGYRLQQSEAIVRLQLNILLGHEYIKTNRQPKRPAGAHTHTYMSSEESLGTLASCLAGWLAGLAGKPVGGCRAGELDIARRRRTARALWLADWQVGRLALHYK